MPEIESTAIEQALDRIRESKTLGGGSRQFALLHYVVGAELAGDGENVKAYSIAIDVLGRDEDFDPSTDSIVRVEFNRLRQMLDIYYLTEGRNEAVRITIPKGSYRPSFAPKTTDDTGDLTTSQGQRRAVGETSLLRRVAFGSAALLVVVLIGSTSFLFLNQQASGSIERKIRAVELTVITLSGDQAIRPLAARLTDSFVSNISKSGTISVRLSASQPYSSISEAFANHVTQDSPTLLFAGTLSSANSGARLLTGLVDPLNGRFVWTQDYSIASDFDSTDILALADKISADIRPALIGAAKQKLAALPLESLNAWELYLLSTYTVGDRLATLQYEKERIVLAERALELEPNLGEAHAALAAKLSLLVVSDPSSDTAETRERARFHADRAEQLSSTNPDVLYILGLANGRLGRQEKSLQQMHRVLELDSGHILGRLVNAIGTTYCGTDPDKAIETIKDLDASLSPSNPVRWATLGVLARIYLVNGQYDLAYDAQVAAAQIGFNPEMALQHAAILNELGETQEAIAIVNSRRQDWPTLDPAHYGNIALPRICGDIGDMEKAAGPFLRLADALK